jgi:amino acid transporter
MGIVSGNIAAAIVTGYIVPSTDALFLVLVGAILTVIVLIALGKLFYWVALAATRGTSQSSALEGPRSERERRREQLSVGVWANVLLLLCQFLMLISAFVALQLLLEMFKLYYQTMPPGMLLQLIAIVWLVLIILFFLVYPGIGLFGHANDVIDSGATKRAAR